MNIINRIKTHLRKYLMLVVSLKTDYTKTDKTPKYIFKDDIEFLKFVNERLIKDMLKSVKKGNSNESIADAIFDRIGFSTKVLREDDYGIDYLCSIGREFGSSIYPTKTFISQLKSSFESITYDLSINGKNNWLIENNIPLFFCVYIENSGKLYFYSSSMINDFIIRGYKNIKKLQFNFQAPSNNTYIINLNVPLSVQDETYIIDCGIPFMEISVLETNSNNIEEYNNYRDILEKIINKDNENITYKNLGLPFMSWLHKYKTNNVNITFGWADYSDDMIITSNELLNKLYQPIITLCNTYYHEGKTEQYTNLKKFVDEINYNDKTKSVLENLGFRDNNGNIINK